MGTAVGCDLEPSPSAGAAPTGRLLVTAQPPVHPRFPWPSSMLGNWIMALIDPLGFLLRFCWWSSERGHPSLPCLLRQLPTYQRAELISLELLASNQEPDSKNILELLKTESVTIKMCSWIYRAPSQSVLAGLKKGLPAHTTDSILYYLYSVVHSIHHQDADDALKDRLLLSAGDTHRSWRFCHYCFLRENGRFIVHIIVNEGLFWSRIVAYLQAFIYVSHCIIQD